jgi:hypothetical protein
MKPAAPVIKTESCDIGAPRPFFRFGTLSLRHGRYSLMQLGRFGAVEL